LKIGIFQNVLKLFVNRAGENGKKAGIMIPIPQYPLYSASIEEFNLGQVGYYLDEDNGWALSIDELERSFAEAKDHFDMKALVVINPGNPTGQVLTKQNIEEIIKFAHKHRLFVFADEVRKCYT
jgi:alanine transaminase